MLCLRHNHISADGAECLEQLTEKNEYLYISWWCKSCEEKNIN